MEKTKEGQKSYKNKCYICFAIPCNWRSSISFTNWKTPSACDLHKNKLQEDEFLVKQRRKTGPRKPGLSIQEDSGRYTEADYQTWMNL